MKTKPIKENPGKAGRKRDLLDENAPLFARKTEDLLRHFDDMSMEELAHRLKLKSSEVIRSWRKGEKPPAGKYKQTMAYLFHIIEEWWDDPEMSIEEAQARYGARQSPMNEDIEQKTAPPISTIPITEGDAFVHSVVRDCLKTHAALKELVNREEEKLKILDSAIRNAHAYQQQQTAREHHDPSQPLFEVALNFAPGLIYLLRLSDRRNVFVNPAVEKLLDLSRQQIANMGPGDILQLFHPDDRRPYLEAINALEKQDDEAVRFVSYRLKGK